MAETERHIAAGSPHDFPVVTDEDKYRVVEPFLLFRFIDKFL